MSPSSNRTRGPTPKPSVSVDSAANASSRTICSPAPKPAAGAPRRCTRWLKPPSSMASTRSSTLPTCSPASPITRPDMLPIFFPGTGSPSSPIAPPLNWRLHRALTALPPHPPAQHHTPRRVQFRLFLHAGAYWLLWSLRRAMPRRSPWRVMLFDTLRLRLIKLAARRSAGL
jgi:hypothetical protein